MRAFCAGGTICQYFPVRGEVYTIQTRPEMKAAEKPIYLDRDRVLRGSGTDEEILHSDASGLIRVTRREQLVET